MRILLAEDDRHLRKIIEIILSSMGGHVVHSVDNGQKALDALLHNSSYDLALIDLNLPLLSGQSCLKKYLELSPSSHCPVILMSANLNENLSLELQELGAVGVVEKPFAPTQLCQMIENILSQKSAA